MVPDRAQLHQISGRLGRSTLPSFLVAGYTPHSIVKRGRTNRCKGFNLSIASRQSLPYGCSRLGKGNAVAMSSSIVNSRWDYNFMVPSTSLL